MGLAEYFKKDLIKMRKPSDNFGMGDLEALAAQCDELKAEAEGDEADRAAELDLEATKVVTVNDVAPMIRIANVIIQRAITEGANETHLVLAHNGVSNWMRIDGKLHEVMRLPRYCHAPLMSRLKIMSGMNIAERRLPQTGQISIRCAGKDYDLRTSTLPTAMGEEFFIRFLIRNLTPLNLEGMGMTPDQKEKVMEIARSNYGLLLLNGTGQSGTTTTAYSILSLLRDEQRRRILTVEKTIEADLRDVSQIRINRQIGLNRQMILEGVLNQVPDVLMVDCIDSPETLDLCLQLSRKCMVIAVSSNVNNGRAVRQLVKMVDSPWPTGKSAYPDSVSAVLRGVLNQRLVRLNCKNCMKPYVPNQNSLSALAVEQGGEADLKRSDGCDNCRFTSFRGRIGMFELSIPSRETLDAIASAGDFETSLENDTDITILERARSLVLNGLTTAEEAVESIF